MSDEPFPRPDTQRETRPVARSWTGTTHTHTYTKMFTHTRTHTYSHTLTHTHVHTRTHTPPPQQHPKHKMLTVGVEKRTGPITTPVGRGTWTTSVCPDPNL